MSKAYIVLTYTGTVLSKVVKIYTRCDYGHVSIALDENLDEMYSFGRKRAYNAFIGGFVSESSKFGTFKRFSGTKTLILEIEVNNYQYKKMKKAIKKLQKNKDFYKFNVLGLFLTTIKIKRNRPNSFYCAEFVKHLLDEVNYSNNLPDVVVPKDFLKLENAKEVYKGILRNYHQVNI